MVDKESHVEGRWTRGGGRERIPEGGGGERERCLNDERDGIGEEEEEVTFDFPILDVPTTFVNELRMKNIPPLVIPNFHCIAFE